MNASWTGYGSLLSIHIEHYLATKRALGCKFNTEDRTLRLLDRWFVENPVDSVDKITSAHLNAFLASRPRPKPRGYNSLLGAVRRLFDWLVNQQVIAKSPVQAQPRPETEKSQPFLFDSAAIRQLLEEAGRL